MKSLNYEEISSVVRCDQCEMLSINGVACHEHGCPNAKKTWVADRGWVRFLECRECGDEVEVGETCSCHANDEAYCSRCQEPMGHEIPDSRGLCSDCVADLDEEDEDEEEDEEEVVANA